MEADSSSDEEEGEEEGEEGEEGHEGQEWQYREGQGPSSPKLAPWSASYHS